MSAAQIFTMQHSSRINSAGYPNSFCQYQSPVKVEHIDQSLEIISKHYEVQVLPCGVTLNKFSGDVC
jgi:hypothetical protein